MTYIRYVAMLALLVLVFIGALLWLWPYHPIDIKKFSVSVAEVSPEQYLRLDLDYCKPVGNEFVADVQLLYENDPQMQTSYPVQQVMREALPVGCHVVPLYALIPDIPPGRYRVLMHRSYHPNFIRWIDVYATSGAFTIVRKAVSVAALPEIQDLVRVNKDLLAANRTLLRQNDELLRAMREVLRRK